MLVRPHLLLLGVMFGALISCKGQGSQGGMSRGFDLQSISRSGNIVSSLSSGIWVVHHDLNNNYWFGSSEEGLYRYDGKIVVHYSIKDGLADNRIREIKEDQAGNVYINTPNGIDKWDGKLFTRLAMPAKNEVSEWRLQPGDLWFKASDGYTFRYDGKRLHRLKFPKHPLEEDYNRQYPNTPINPYDTYCIYKDSKGNVWFGTGALGIIRYNGSGFGYLYEEHLTLIKNGGSFGIRSIMEDSRGKYWFCNTRYRYRILPGASAEKSKGYINYVREEGIPIMQDRMGGDRMYYQTIIEDSTGALWMQTYENGIWRYAGGKLTHYSVTDGDAPVKIISMYRDRKGGLWLATAEKGAWTLRGKRFERFNVK